MPRTKLPKTAKRNRDNAKEERENRLREIEIEVNTFLAKYTDEVNAVQKTIDQMCDELLKLPSHIKAMKMSDVKKLTATTYEDLLNHIDSTGKDANLSTDSASAVPNRQSTDDELNGFQIVRKSFKEDEGYLTEEQTRNSVTSSIRSVGPLSSAIRSRRRSNSASSYLTRPLLSVQKTCKLRTPAKGLPVMTTQQMHSSRSKFRTPAQNRLLTMSADRNGLVTPKISNDASPLAILRYQKYGETVISLAGSPVIPSHSAPDTAIINIPTENGMFALKPNNMRVDNLAEIAGSIDQTTWLHLKKLHENLSLIMNNVEP